MHDSYTVPTFTTHAGTCLSNQGPCGDTTKATSGASQRAAAVAESSHSALLANSPLIHHSGGRLGSRPPQQQLEHHGWMRAGDAHYAALRAEVQAYGASATKAGLVPGPREICCAGSAPDMLICWPNSA
mmetsp:Transcript_117472/g.292883  ORF Transcript_117472/g.292883 Transcript_117472/m.292883 type:complete len:129 (-) Transcript_117472:703-1089(-)